MSFRPIMVGAGANLHDWRGRVMTGARQWSAPYACEFGAEALEINMRDEQTHVAIIFPPISTPEGTVWPCIVQVASDPNGAHDARETE